MLFNTLPSSQGNQKPPPNSKKQTMKKQAYIYFMANQHNNVLYIGVTNNLSRRVAEHKAKVVKGFTYKYNCDKLVYYEAFDIITDAISREKNWKREWKNKLVNDENAEWNDLSESVGVDDELINIVREYYKEIAGQARNDGWGCAVWGLRVKLAMTVGVVLFGDCGSSLQLRLGLFC